MSFIVQKSLGNNFFRFAVGRRRDARSIDENPELSTGSNGEFIRHRPEIFYAADVRTIRSPEVPPPRSIATQPFWSTMVDGTRRGYIMLGLIALGALLLLLGLAVVSSKGAAGVFWIILGLVLIAIPFVITLQKRRVVRAHDTRIRKEREERDARNRELLSAYTAALEKLRDDPSDEVLAYVQRENEKLDLPYAIWADTAIGTVLHVGFSTLARIGADRAAEIAALMDRASDAAGLIAEDALAVKQAVYSTILWHFLADDRLGEQQLKVVRAIQEGFKIKPDDVPIDTSSEAQFIRLRGIDHRNAPRCESKIPLGLHEYCMYSAEIRPTGSQSTTNLYVTNKRVMMDGPKHFEVKVPAIDDILVDADANRVTIRASGTKTPIDFVAGEPIYLGAMTDLATRLDDRPKSFA
ncbi:MAG: hypothetical protein DMF56_11195 [Acidobacteria bacterium]|nr:MAG: hypothetical protein DMF56_11195 [Acidobacteriota bacterium]